MRADTSGPEVQAHRARRGSRLARSLLFAVVSRRKREVQSSSHGVCVPTGEPESDAVGRQHTRPTAPPGGLARQGRRLVPVRVESDQPLHPLIIAIQSRASSTSPPPRAPVVGPVCRYCFPSELGRFSRHNVLPSEQFASHSDDDGVVFCVATHYPPLAMRSHRATQRCRSFASCCNGPSNTNTIILVPNVPCWRSKP